MGPRPAKGKVDRPRPPPNPNPNPTITQLHVLEIEPSPFELDSRRILVRHAGSPNPDSSFDFIAPMLLASVFKLARSSGCIAAGLTGTYPLIIPACPMVSAPHR